MPAYARSIVAAVDDEIMAFRLEADGAINRSAEQFIVGRSPERLAQVRRILMAEAGVQRAGAGDADTVA
jgi:hypothetical protein